VHDEPVVPCLGRLIQPVQRLVEKAYIIRLCRINKSSRLATVDDLREGAVYEWARSRRRPRRASCGPWLT
jgi:hypothetical protein